MTKETLLKRFSKDNIDYKKLINILLPTLLILFSLMLESFLANTLNSLYKDFGINLPFISTIILKFFDIISQYWFILYPILALFFYLIFERLYLFSLKFEKQKKIVVYITGTILITLIVVASIAIGIYLPMYSLSQSIK